MTSRMRHVCEDPPGTSDTPIVVAICVAEELYAASQLLTPREDRSVTCNSRLLYQGIPDTI